MLKSKSTFPNAKQVTDRFHVQQLAFDAVQELRIKYRWEVIDIENAEITSAKEKNKKYEPELLFEQYPLLKTAYELAMRLNYIFENTKVKEIAFTRLAKWYNKIELSKIDFFGTVARSIQANYLSVLNFFDNRSTNAAAESFNAKIKAFRSTFRGVRDINFFLYRLAKIYP